MKEFEKLAASQFFVLDSTNLELASNRLYGFAIAGGRIIQNEDLLKNPEIRLNGGGTYVCIRVKKDSIILEQDIDGSYGIYLFRKGKYFALSNSFWKLVEFVKNKYPLSLNDDYAAALIVSPLSSRAYSQTLIKEIEMIPRNTYISIDKVTKTLTIQNMKINDNSIALESIEAFTIMDDWYGRWTQLLRTLKNQTDNIVIDLSGGFDSRVAFLIALGANIDLNRVRVHSTNDRLHTHEEDYEIASSIAQHFGFQLNKELHTPQFFFKEPETVRSISHYVKSGFHKQMYWKFGFMMEPRFSFGGKGGEIINGHGMFGVNNGGYFIENETNRSKNFSYSFKKPVFHIMENLIDHICNVYNVKEDCPYITLLLYRDTISRHHFGKSNVESLFSNVFSLDPLMDPELRKLKINSPLCQDTKLLMAVLLARYCPDLLEFPFQGGRFISRETISYAKSLNEKNPFVKIKNDTISSPRCKLKVHNFLQISAFAVTRKSLRKEDVEEPIIHAFESVPFREHFLLYFPWKVYYKIWKEYRTRSFFPLEEIFACMAVMEAVEFVEYSSICNREKDYISRVHECRSEFGEVWSTEIYNEILKFSTARVDIKNYGNSNNKIEVLGTSAEYAKPNWFSDNRGQGLVFQNWSGVMRVKLKIIGDGQLSIALGGIDIRGREGTRFPVCIDFTEFILNRERIIDNSHLTCHDVPFVFRRKVLDGEIIDVEIKWRPFTNQSNEYPLLSQLARMISQNKID